MKKYYVTRMQAKENRGIADRIKVEELMCEYEGYVKATRKHPHPVIVKGDKEELRKELHSLKEKATVRQDFTLRNTITDYLNNL